MKFNSTDYLNEFIFDEIFFDSDLNTSVDEIEEEETGDISTYVIHHEDSDLTYVDQIHELQDLIYEDLDEYIEHPNDYVYKFFFGPYLTYDPYRPYTDFPDFVFSYIIFSIFFILLNDLIQLRDFQTTIVADKNTLRLISTNQINICTIDILKNHIIFKFTQLKDIIVYDRPTAQIRFFITYVLSSIKLNKRCFITIQTHELLPIFTISHLFINASWCEREIWDIFGIWIFNTAGQQRLLNDYSFKGYPLRKDFPLSGFYEIHYSERFKKIVSARVELIQQYRIFTFSPEWIQETYLGDNLDEAQIEQYEFPEDEEDLIIEEESEYSIFDSDDVEYCVFYDNLIYSRSLTEQQLIIQSLYEFSTSNIILIHEKDILTLDLYIYKIIQNCQSSSVL